MIIHPGLHHNICVLAGPTLGRSCSNYRHYLSRTGCPGHPTLGTNIVQGFVVSRIRSTPNARVVSPHDFNSHRETLRLWALSMRTGRRSFARLGVCASRAGDLPLRSVLMISIRKNEIQSVFSNPICE